MHMFLPKYLKIHGETTRHKHWPFDSGLRPGHIALAFSDVFFVWKRVRQNESFVPEQSCKKEGGTMANFQISFFDILFTFRLFREFSIWAHVFEVPASWRFLGKPRWRGNLHFSLASFRVWRMWTPEGSSFYSTGTDKSLQGCHENENRKASKQSRNYWIPFKTTTLRERRHSLISIFLTKTYVWAYKFASVKPRWLGNLHPSPTFTFWRR